MESLLLVNVCRQGGRMVLDEKTKYILQNNLKFTPTHLKRLEQNAALLSSTLGLIELLKRESNEAEIKDFARNQFKRIKTSLNQKPLKNNKILKKARSEYYSFQNAK